MKRLSKAKRVVLKVGTNILMKQDKVSTEVIASIAEQVSGEMNNGKEMIIVSSGAVGLGTEKLGMKPEGMSVALQQATASVGQSLLMREYGKAFAKHDKIIAQLLLTSYNFQNKRSLEDLKNVMKELMKKKVVPLINENDPVSSEELDAEGHFDDNDGLASLVAKEFDADLLILFTDVGGIYNENPRECTNAKIVGCLEDLDESKIHFGKKSRYGVGGIKAKVTAVKRATNEGIPVVVCAFEKDSLSNIFNGGSKGSVFLPR